MSEGNSYQEQNSYIADTITEVDVLTFAWKIPDFPVITIQFCKVKFIYNEQEKVGLVNKNETIVPGDVICTKHCTIEIDQTTYMVLWECNKPSNNGREPVAAKPMAASMSENISSNQPAENGPIDRHTLPFKVLGTCFSQGRQTTSENAYEYLNKYNRPVFVDLVAEPENAHDQDAIAVYIMYEDEFEKLDTFHMSEYSICTQY